jgi:TPR repeat protein
VVGGFKFWIETDTQIQIIQRMTANTATFLYPKETEENGMQQLLKLAQNGQVSAMNEVALYYQVGIGGVHHLKRQFYLLQAVHWFVKAAQQGNDMISV